MFSVQLFASLGSLGCLHVAGASFFQAGVAWQLPLLNSTVRQDSVSRIYLQRRGKLSGSRILSWEPSLHKHVCIMEHAGFHYELSSRLIFHGSLCFTNMLVEWNTRFAAIGSMRPPGSS